jgi:ankyrin repeat protein
MPNNKKKKKTVTRATVKLSAHQLNKALQSACFRGILTSRDRNVLSVRVCIAAGADVNFADGEKNMSCLMVAIAGSFGPIVTALIAACASVHAKDKEGNAALNFAAFMGKPECIQLVLDAGADFEGKNAIGYTPMINAAHEGNSKSMELLLRAGANKEAKAKRGLTALYVAAKMHSIECLKLLIKAGANIHAKFPLQGSTALHQVSSQGSPECVKLLVDAGCDVNAISLPSQGDITGASPLALAVKISDNVECVRALVRGGADVSFKWNGKSMDELAGSNPRSRTRDAMKAALRLPVEMRCGKCGAASSGNILKCTDCMKQYYCNRKCQFAHWQIHKPVCKLNKKDDDDKQSQPSGTGASSLSSSSSSSSSSSASSSVAASSSSSAASSISDGNAMAALAAVGGLLGNNHHAMSTSELASSMSMPVSDVTSAMSRFPFFMFRPNAGAEAAADADFVALAAAVGSGSVVGSVGAPMNAAAQAAADTTAAELATPMTASEADAKAEAKAARRVCNHCGEKALQKCSACRSVHYCSVKCSGDDWKQHKKVCKALAAARENKVV